MAPSSSSAFLYAHGFKSSSRSRKAGQLAAYLGLHRPKIDFIAPDLSFDPSIALEQLEAACRDLDPDALTLVGSSLGGFYATVLAEKLSCRAVLLNPALRPFESLAGHLGPQTNLYSGEAFEWQARHLDFLRARCPAAIKRPGNYLVIVEMGDELLDHRETLRYFAGAKSIVEECGSHELASFPRHIPALVEFAAPG